MLDDVPTIATALLDAERTRTARGRVTVDHPNLDVRMAYDVQRELIARKLSDGEMVVGVKLGLTSRAKQQRMGVDSPLTAVLTDQHVLHADEPVRLDRFIHPRVEPEIAFVMDRELAGPGVTSATALAAVRAVHGAFEVIDSRFIDYDFALPDVIADNASSALFLLGSVGVSPRALDLALEAVVLSVGGGVVDTATGAAVQGHPAEALALAANALATRGQSIPAGAVVLTGGLTDAVPLQVGVPVSAEFTTLGSVTIVAE